MREVCEIITAKETKETREVQYHGILDGVVGQETRDKKPRKQG
jgi:hypothetical protein